MASPLRFRFISDRALSLAPVDSGRGGLVAEREKRERERGPRTREEKRAPERDPLRDRRSESTDGRRQARPRARRRSSYRWTRGSREEVAAGGAAGEAATIASRSSNDRNPSNDAARHLSLHGTSCVRQILQLLPAFLRTYLRAPSSLPLSLHSLARFSSFLAPRKN